MPLLYYWRSDNYRRDLDMGAGFHLNQSSKRLHDIDIGDSLWAFTRDGGGKYLMAAELVVRAKTLNPPAFRYGRYRIWGDIRWSRYFQVAGQPSAETILRALSCRVAPGRALGQSFQGPAAVRNLSVGDHQMLVEWAKGLPLEPRARILPEEQLEATLALGDGYAVRRLIQEEPSGIAEERQQYFFTQAPTRNKQLTKELQELYGGRCQICLWDPRNEYGQPLCQGHHINWLSRGGADIPENMVLICPNHHSAVHGCDAPLDFGDMAFDFGIRREALKLDYHLNL
jgi:5-methylcytosine-specific restriction enzyme A